jgi:hypothetical protein
MISVVTFKWGTKYTAAHVNRLRRMVDQYYTTCARMICVTNDAKGINERVEIVADTEDFAGVPSPVGGPSCYRRLRVWREDAARWFGERFVVIDLDVAAVAPLASLWDRPEPIVAYADPYYAVRGQVCGSMLLLTAGARPSVWRDFDPATSPKLAAKFRGSDQAWLSHCLWDVPRWTTADGVYSYKKDVLPRKGNAPDGARLVVFHGEPKPWDVRGWT